MNEKISIIIECNYRTKELKFIGDTEDIKIVMRELMKYLLNLFTKRINKTRKAKHGQ